MNTLHGCIAAYTVKAEMFFSSNRKQAPCAHVDL